MPVRQVGPNCYQWGNQKVYCGKDAKRKAILQGIAIENTGWREAEDARDFAREKHEGQMYGDKPYMTHVEDVASGFEDTYLREIAYLHDVVEDSDVTIQEIRERFGEKVSVAVDALTRRKESYFDYIRRVKEHPQATQIKLADLHANLKNNPKESLAKRYHKAIGILTNKKEAEESPATGDETFEIIFMAYKKKFGDREHLIFGQPIDESEIIEEIDIFVDKMVTVFTLEQLEGGFDRVTEVQTEYPNDGRITILTALFGMAIDKKVWWMDLQNEWESEEVEESTIPIVDLTREDLDHWPIDMTHIDFHIADYDRQPTTSLYLVNENYLVFDEQKDDEILWRIYDIGRGGLVGWSYLGAPLREKYENLEWHSFHQGKSFKNYEDCISHLDWLIPLQIYKVNRLWELGENAIDGLFLLTDRKRAALKNKMTKKEEEYRGKSANRGADWLPNRIKIEETVKILQKLQCYRCKRYDFQNLTEARRHEHFCRRYGLLPANGFFFTMMEKHLIQMGVIGNRDGNSLDNKTDKV